MSEEIINDKFVVAKNIKEYINNLGGRSEPEVSKKINDLVKEIVDKSYERAKLNGRSTVMVKDV